MCSFWKLNEIPKSSSPAPQQWGAERCPDTGMYVGYVPGFPGAHTQAESLDELNTNLREVIGMLLEEGESGLEAEFVGTQTVIVG
jgi:predicted RNase H-like HicB family nuclease